MTKAEKQIVYRAMEIVEEKEEYSCHALGTIIQGHSVNYMYLEFIQRYGEFFRRDIGFLWKWDYTHSRRNQRLMALAMFAETPMEHRP